MNQLEFELLRVKLGTALIFLNKAHERNFHDADVQRARLAVAQALERLGPVDYEQDE
ncbi:hypothetical protein [Paraburkholderia tropica]|uniref:hypothetical protein n=1 Tax=Paraburkholderia tropica TaxID=92647 RepID=UPI001591A891|nr:hypothetical protein [Paraburkholderia tropica]